MDVVVVSIPENGHKLTAVMEACKRPLCKHLLQARSLIISVYKKLDSRTSMKTATNGREETWAHAQGYRQPCDLRWLFLHADGLALSPLHMQSITDIKFKEKLLF